MRLIEFQLHNYKSFLDSGTITLAPGFNIFTGQNNAGKTALLEGLSLNFKSKPHRSSTTIPTPRHETESHSSARFRIEVSWDELEEFLKTTSEWTFVPFPRDFNPGQGAQEILNRFRAAKQFQIEAKFYPGSTKLEPAKDPSFGLYGHDLKRGWMDLPSKNSQGGGQHGGITASNTLWLGDSLGRLFISRIYGFKAERLNIGKSPAGTNRELASNASNLPEVLSILQGNPARFDRYNHLVKRVLPQIERVTVRPIDKGAAVEIFIWNENPEEEREDLAIPLAESGTGISQVLAMLYVLTTADTPRTIIIDEPNSFLHPGASRALMEIFREHPRHQYIISTHSPELISTSNPSTIHAIRRAKGPSTIEKIDPNETRHLRSLLLEVGSRLSDVFGADSILWVEGKTEELCFPMIIREILGRPLAGLSVIGVLHTGDFDSEDAQAVFKIYELLTQGKALLPPAIAFIFDRELRPDIKREDLVRRSQKRVAFLNRRTYENYLLDTPAITSVLNAQAVFKDSPLTEEAVQKWLDAHASDPKYYIKSKTKDFLKDVDAPKLLEDLFSGLSEAKLEYRKIEHSIAITEWLIRNKPETLREIADLLASKLPEIHLK